MGGGDSGERKVTHKGDGASGGRAVMEGRHIEDEHKGGYQGSLGGAYCHFLEGVWRILET